MGYSRLSGPWWISILRRCSGWFLLLTVGLFLSNAALAQSGQQLRPLKGKSDNGAAKASPSAVRVKPLEGKVDYHDATGGIDWGRFRGKLDSFRGRGQAGSGQLQGGASQSSGQGGLNHPSLRGGTGAQDQNRPFSLDTNRLGGNISDKELALLGSHDVVVIQDRSSSMGDKERFPSKYEGRSKKMSRWQWCLEQTMDLTRATSRLPGKGITLITFSSKYDVYENVTLQQLPSIFARNHLYIGTRLCPPLEDVLEQYFARKAAGKARPLVIAVITDGIPQDDDELRKLVIRTTHRMRDPGEISMTFLQVGTEEDGVELLSKLDRKLIRKGAQFDIVKTKTFYELLEFGLARALVDAIQRDTAVQ